MKPKKLFYTHNELLQDPKYVKALTTRFSIAHETAGIIEHARIHMGWTQEQVAKAIKTTQSSVARAEGGKIAPGLEFIQKIAKAFGTNVHIVFESMPQIVPTAVKYAYLAKPAAPASPAPKSAAARTRLKKTPSRAKGRRPTNARNRSPRVGT